MNRKLLPLLLTLGLLAAVYATCGRWARATKAPEAPAPAAAPTRVFVNGLPLREEALVKDGVTYVPLRAVAEALHCEVLWDKKSGVQIWSNVTPNPNKPEVPGADFNPYPRPVAPRAPSPGAPRP